MTNFAPCVPGPIWHAEVAEGLGGSRLLYDRDRCLLLESQNQACSILTNPLRALRLLKTLIYCSHMPTSTRKPCFRDIHSDNIQNILAE